MERRVREAQRCLDGGGGRVEPFNLPGGIGPLPAEQRERAMRLLGATRDMERRLAQEMGSLSAEMATERRRTARPAPTYFDRKI